MGKKWQKLFVVGLAFLLLVGCSSNTTKKDTTASSQSSESQSNSADSRVFVDSSGREVKIPNKITKVAPSGSLAQIVLYTSSPDLLVGLASPFSEEAREFIDEKYQNLPEFGQFYGKSSNLNMEAVSAAEPDIIIDIGEVKDTVKEDMDNLQEQLSIPTVFIEANLENMSETYKKLGELLGNTKETEKLSEYCQKVIDQSNDVRLSLKESEKKSIYYASGNAGLNTNAEGSFHAQVFEQVGVNNVVTGVEGASKGSGTVISMEQLIQWQPDVIVADTEDVYTLITTDDSWKELEAVKKGTVYKIPTAPYNFLGSPPSVNRIIGIQWLGELVYPEQYNLDTKETINEFYKLFYHTEPTEKEREQILNHAV